MRPVFLVILIAGLLRSHLLLCCYAPALCRIASSAFATPAITIIRCTLAFRRNGTKAAGPSGSARKTPACRCSGNPTAAVLYPGKLVFAVLPYKWAARIYIVAHSALAFAAMLVLMRSWGMSWGGSGLAALSYTFGAPILFQYCNIIYLVGAAWLPLGFHAVDRWVRLGRRWAIFELAFVLAMQVLGGDPQAAFLLGSPGSAMRSALDQGPQQRRIESRAIEEQHATHAPSRPCSPLAVTAVGAGASGSRQQSSWPSCFPKFRTAPTALRCHPCPGCPGTVGRERSPCWRPSPSLPHRWRGRAGEAPWG